MDLSFLELLARPLALETTEADQRLSHFILTTVFLSLSSLYVNNIRLRAQKYCTKVICFHCREGIISITLSIIFSPVGNL